MKRWAVFLAVLALFVLPGLAHAVATPLTLVGPIQSDILGPQSTSNPCIIARGPQAKVLLAMTREGHRRC